MMFLEKVKKNCIRSDKHEGRPREEEQKRKAILEKQNRKWNLLIKLQIYKETEVVDLLLLKENSKNSLLQNPSCPVVRAESARAQSARCRGQLWTERGRK